MALGGGGRGGRPRGAGGRGRARLGQDAGAAPGRANPSAIAKEPCQADAQHELAEVLGVKGKVGTPTWADHRYS